ncbi:Mov34/MPN/PAD-1 family protein [Candidatus Woesearchaeota archaeon]|nr:Mov34/MPN/PAD-1 family protein [Candidatus Woesearchaeota archaeon]
MFLVKLINPQINNPLKTMPRKISTAVIQEQAFVSLLTAALEVYNKETFGLLVGSVKEGRYKSQIIIKNALTYQNATRKEKEVSIWPSRDARIRYVINYLSGCKIIGEFHSHTYGVDHLTKHDIKDMIEDGERFSLLISIEPAEFAEKWFYDKKNKSLHGTVNDDYFITIKVYAREYDKKVVRKLKLECPYIEKLNKEYEKSL